MKNILLMIKQLFLSCYKNILIFEGIVAGGYLFGFIISFIIYKCDDEHTFINLGTFMAMTFIAIIIFFGIVFTCSADFVLAISFGKSRKDFLVARYLLYVVEFMGAFAIVKLGSFIDTAIGKTGVPIDFMSVPSWGTFVVAALVVPTICICISALYTRFERKAFFFLWGIWMLVSVGAPRIATAMKKEPDSAAAAIGFFFQKAISIGSTQFFIVAAVVGVVVMTLNFFIYKFLEAKL